jgi:hypothetical protein
MAMSFVLRMQITYVTVSDASLNVPLIGWLRSTNVDDARHFLGEPDAAIIDRTKKIARKRKKVRKAKTSEV